MRTISLLFSSVLAFSLFSGCSDSSSDNQAPADDDVIDAQGPSGKVARSTLEREKAPDVSDADKAALIDGHNAFAFGMYDLVRSEEGANENMFFSPTSMTLALSMAYAGAVGKTAEEMAEALHYTLPPEKLFPTFNWLDQELGQRADEAFQKAKSNWEIDKYGEAPSAQDFRLHIVNSMWGEQTMNFESPFLDTLAVNYDAGVFLSDFKNNPDVERIRINDWVARETRDRIKDLLPEDSISGDTRSVLVNAIHMKLPWEQKFDGVDDLSFTLLDGSTQSVAAIGQNEFFGYAEDDGLQAVRIPLKGSSIELVLVAPAQGKLEAFEAGLTHESFKTLYNGMQSQNVDVRIPKLNFTTPTIMLRSKLETMGMPTPFMDGAADFSGISKDEPLHISDVAHKAMLGIDENGVEAAAATAVIVGIETSIADPPVVFDVDRPFFVAIVDAPTETVLFVGHIVAPVN